MKTFVDLAETAMEMHFDKYQSKVEELAASVQKWVINPWLDKHGCHILCGNGTWYIGQGKTPLYEEDLPEHIAEILNLAVPGMPSNCFGSFMTDYSGEKDEPAG